MATKKAPQHDYVNEVMEHIIEHTNMAGFDPKKKVIDFRLSDIVECTYIKGLFEVVDIYPTQILILPKDHKGEGELVKPGFLRKVNISKDTMKVLYD